MIFTFNDSGKVKPSDSEYTKLTTINSITGNNLPDITGCGYLTIRRIGDGPSDSLGVFVDGSTQVFPLNSIVRYGVTEGGFYKIYFQEKISFTGKSDNHRYFYQTLLAEKPIVKKYNIVNGTTKNTDYVTISGKGKILVSASSFNPAMIYSIDGSSEYSFAFNGYQYMEFEFKNSFKFKSSTSTYAIYYLVYLEK